MQQTVKIKNENHITVWDNCLNIIRDNVNDQSFKIWFSPIEPMKLENNVLTIKVPSHFFYEWLEEKYVHLLRKTIKHELGKEGRLEYSIVVENSSDEDKSISIKIPTSSSGIAKNPPVNLPLNIGTSIKNIYVIPGLKKTSINPNLNPNYTFDTFVEGECNALARAAGFAVANKPGNNQFNPLLVYGGTGLGKTHLVQAIGNLIKELYPEKTVLYTSSIPFTNEFISALKNGNIVDFHNLYEQIDVLLIDDIQYFSGKERTQDVFFHLFNNLYQAGKQIVLTSDCSPMDLQGVEERLVSRFKWGLTTDLQVPDFETRVAILQKKMYSNGIELPVDVIEYIAHNISSNVRELEGAMVSLLAQSSLNRKEINLNLAKQLMKNFVRNITKEISLEYIVKLVSEYFELPVDALKAKTRKREIVQARQIAMFFAKDLTKSSLKSIGLHFGNRDHSTVIHAVQTVNDLLFTDKKFKQQVDEIHKKIKLNTT